MANQNDPPKPPGQAGGTAPVPNSGAGGDKGGTQKGGGSGKQPSGGANRPPQEGRV